MTVEFRLLGPMEVRHHGRPVALPRPAERELLALLLLSAGRTVPATSIVDRIWSGNALPENPLNALQLRVSKLRRALADVELDLVHREPPGYRMAIDPTSVDVHLFTHHVRAARAETARGAGAASAAVEHYETALGLWRGDPLADFAGAMWATVETARMTQLRLAALHEQAELHLALGRPADVIVNLEPVAAEHPEQEGLVGLLMTALYQSGRQSDAIEVFLRTQRSLDEEMGLEPSAQLGALHQRILRQDATLQPTPQLPAPPPVPTQFGPHGDAPAPSAELIGRDDDVAAASALLFSNRVVTLVGPGGAGKTALALAVAHARLTSFPDGARVVRLAALTRAADLPLAVAEAVGVPLAGVDPSTPVRDRLLSYLTSRQLLLVLDNCEHLVDAVARLVENIAATAQDVVVLATSREALAVPGEVQYAVAPLDVPPESTPPQEIATFAAAQLLLRRARALRSDLTPTDVELLAVGEICRHLDGMPLALELAAARIGVLGISEVAVRLKDRFGLLTTGPRTAEERHRTLRSTVDWSYALLGPREQLAFGRLAVFHGGWTLAAAEAVVAGGQIAPEQVLDLLTTLVARSLVVSEAGELTRFRMLETLRHYAHERLEAGGEAAAVRERHAAYFLTFAERADTELRGPGQHRALRALRQEHANLSAALSWFTGYPESADDALKLGGALGLYWHLGRHVEGREVLRALLHDVRGGSAAARAQALQAVSLVERPRGCLVHPTPQGAASAAESLELFVKTGDEARAALSRVLLAVEHLDGSDTQRFASLLDAAERQFVAVGDDWGLAVIAFVRLQHFLVRGERRQARRAGRVACDAFRALDDLWGLSAVLYHLGWGLREFGDYAEAVAVLEEAIEVAESAGMINTAQWALGDLGLALLYLGEKEAAEASFARARSVATDIGDAAGGHLADYGQAVRARLQGDADAARALYRRAGEGFRRLGTGVYAAHAEAGLAWCDLAQQRYESAEERYAELRRVRRSLGEPVLDAIAQEGLAYIEAVRGRADAATALLSEAAALRAAAGRPAAPPEQAQLDAIRRELGRAPA